MIQHLLIESHFPLEHMLLHTELMPSWSDRRRFMIYDSLGIDLLAAVAASWHDYLGGPRTYCMILLSDWFNNMRSTPSEKMISHFLFRGLWLCQQFSSSSLQLNNSRSCLLHIARLHNLSAAPSVVKLQPKVNQCLCWKNRDVCWKLSIKISEWCYRCSHFQVQLAIDAMDHKDWSYDFQSTQS